MCFDKHCHVQIRVMYEGVFVAKCIKAHVDWSIKNLKVRTHAPHTRARARTRAHTHTHTSHARARRRTATATTTRGFATSKKC